MSEIRLLVVDPSGLHARPAARFVQAASRFASRIALLGLTIRPQSEITLAADGPDAEAAIAALQAELGPYVSPVG